MIHVHKNVKKISASLGYGLYSCYIECVRYSYTLYHKVIK